MHPIWDFLSKVSVIAFIAAVVLAIVGRRLFVSSTKREAKLGTKIISSVGGPRNARYAKEEYERRKSALK